MKKIFLLFLFYLVIIGLTLADSITFIKTFGGDGSDYARSVQQTIDGGYIMTGWTNSFNDNLTDVYLIKTDSSGNEIWSKTFGGRINESGFCVQQTKDEGYIITGNTNSFGAGKTDIYMIKTNSNGNETWSKTFGGNNNDEGYCVQQTKDNGYIIVGDTYSFGAGKNDIYFIKTDSSGNEIWSKTFGGSNWEFGFCAEQTEDGGYIIAGRTKSFGAGDNDLYLIKTDSKGNETWSKTFGSNKSEDGFFVQQTKDNGYIIAGNTVSDDSSSGLFTSDIYIIKTDSSGNEIWSKTFGGDAWDHSESVQQTIDGGYIITGNTKSYGNGESDVYLLKIDSSGNEVWSKTFGSSGNDEGFSVQQTTDGGFIITGKTGFEYGISEADAYLIKTDSEGNVE